MNQTTTGCATCYYYSNGRCFYGVLCYGTQMICINGTMITLPINEIKLEENDDE